MSSGRRLGFETVPELHADALEHRRMLARAVNRLTAGKLNGTTEIRLEPNAAATTVIDPRLAPDSILLWMPRTAAASAAERAGIWVTGRTKGSATLNHAASSDADQDFTLLIIG
jgi:hypothetical protein